MTTLAEVKDDWHLLFDKFVPRFAEGRDVTMLWSSGHYDGPACGVCMFLGRPYWFDRVSGGTHNVEYRGLEIASYIYVFVELTDEEFALEKKQNDLFREHVGDYCNYTYEVIDEDGEEREYRRIRGKAQVVDTKAGYKNYCAAFEYPGFSRHYGKHVVGWWSR